jgi:hypothetical protein
VAAEGIHSKRLCPSLFIIGTTFLGVRDAIKAKHLLTKAYNLQRRILGESDSATIQTEMQLLRITFFKKGKASGERDEQYRGVQRGKSQKGTSNHGDARESGEGCECTLRF